jgi:hypothetical protein
MLFLDQLVDVDINVGSRYAQSIVEMLVRSHASFRRRTAHRSTYFLTMRTSSEHASEDQGMRPHKCSLCKMLSRYFLKIAGGPRQRSPQARSGPRAMRSKPLP